MRRFVTGVLSFLIAASLFAQGNLVSGVRKGKASPPSENEDNQPDPPPPVMVVQRIAPVNTAGAKHVTDLQNAQAFLQALGHEVANWRINTALIGGNKYMANDCAYGRTSPIRRSSAETTCKSAGT